MTMLTDDIKPFRLQMSDYERKHPWLSLLLDSYALIDLSVAETINSSEKNIACRKGCSACCSHVIPLSILEVLGIKFYVQNILNINIKTLLIKKLNKDKSICIFNIDDCCVIYQLRPIACRRYMISSQVCTINEDPTISRPGDVITPSREYLNRAIEMTLPFYKSQNIYVRDHESIFNFYKRNNIILSSIYDNII